MRQPLTGRRLLVVHRRGRHQVEQDQRSPAVSGDGKVHGAQGVGGRVTEDQVDILGVEELRGPAGLRLLVDHADIVDLAQAADPLLKKAIIAFQPLQQARKLHPVLWMADGVEANAGRLRGLDRLEEIHENGSLSGLPSGKRWACHYMPPFSASTNRREERPQILAPNP